VGTAAPGAAPVTVTSVLQEIWDDDGEKIAVAALAASGPFGASIAAILNEPLIGPVLTGALNDVVNWLIAAGVIEIKIGIINFMSDVAKAKWANELQILQQVQSAGNTFTPDQQAAYDAALQQLVEDHPGVVNA
jgi:hypothetical protein